jgi:hypothetical protein
MRSLTWFLRNRVLVLAATAVVLAVGVAAWVRLPIDAFPDVTGTQVMILSQSPGLAAVDVEQRVSYPIELAMRGLPRVTGVRSLSKAGLSQVVITFEDGADTYWTRQVVFERLAAAREQLPPGTDAELGPHQHRPGRDLPVHARGRGPGPHGAAQHPGLAGGAAAQADCRRERGQQLRRPGQAVPGAGGPGPPAGLRAHLDGRGRGHRARATPMPPAA